MRSGMGRISRPANRRRSGIRLARWRRIQPDVAAASRCGSAPCALCAAAAGAGGAEHLAGRFTAPRLGRESSTVSIDAEFGDNTSGVLYALGGSGGGLTLYMDKGQLVYEYNMMIIERYIARSASKLPSGKHRIDVTTTLASAKPLSPAEVVLAVNGR